MAQDRDDLLKHYAGMRADMLDAIKGLTREQATETTIDGWSVADHLLHMATWDDLRAAEVERISAGFDSVLRMSDEQDGVLNELMYQFRRGLSYEQAMYEYEGSRARLLAAIQSATDRGLDESLYGEAGLRSSHEAEHAGWIRRWRGEKGY